MQSWPIALPSTSGASQLVSVPVDDDDPPSLPDVLLPDVVESPPAEVDSPPADVVESPPKPVLASDVVPIPELPVAPDMLVSVPGVVVDVGPAVVLSSAPPVVGATSKHPSTMIVVERSPCRMAGG
jgi:hypothetical protein